MKVLASFRCVRKMPMIVPTNKKRSERNAC